MTHSHRIVHQSYEILRACAEMPGSTREGRMMLDGALLHLLRPTESRRTTRRVRAARRGISYHADRNGDFS